MKIVRAERPRGLGDACSEASAPEGRRWWSEPPHGPGAGAPRAGRAGV